MKKLLLICVAVTLAHLAVCQAEYLSVPDDFATIQQAIDASVTGDTVLVAAGEYTGPGNRDIDFRGKDIVVRSRSISRIDCQSTMGDPHVGFKFYTNETLAARLEGFTIVNAGFGDGPWTAGICILNGSSPSISDCIITDCENGIVCEAGSNPNVSHCMVYGNSGIGLAWGAHSRGSITNCQVTENGQHGTAFGHIGEPTIVNCTVADNGGYGAWIDESNPVFLNCIVYGNISGSLDVTISQPDVQYCLVEGGYTGQGNIDADPEFVSGPHGNYYLFYHVTGQQKSVCVDAGNTGADGICFQAWKELICMSDLTTRTNELPDIDTVDMGYHYSPMVVPTPTPLPTTVDVSMDLPVSPVTVGSEFFARMRIDNNAGDTFTDIPMFCVLEIAGGFFFYPRWTTQVEWHVLTEIDMGLTEITVFEPFTWPGGVAPGSGRFFCGLLTQDITGLLGNLAVGDFNWE